VTNGWPIPIPLQRKLDRAPDPRIDPLTSTAQLGPNPNGRCSSGSTNDPALREERRLRSWTVHGRLQRITKPPGHAVGSRLPPTPDPTPRQALLERLYRNDTAQEEGRFPYAFVQRGCSITCIRTSPGLSRFGETDDWGSRRTLRSDPGGRATIWTFLCTNLDTMQSMLQYRGQTTLSSH